MNNKSELRDRELEGNIHALLMDFRNECLEARSQLHQTGDADTTTNRIIVAQARADKAIQTLITQRETQLLDRVIEQLNGMYELSLSDVQLKEYQTKMEVPLLSKTEVIKSLETLKKEVMK
jgi:hypothetical protein